MTVATPPVHLCPPSFPARGWGLQPARRTWDVLAALRTKRLVYNTHGRHPWHSHGLARCRHIISGLCWHRIWHACRRWPVRQGSQRGCNLSSHLLPLSWIKVQRRAAAVGSCCCGR